ncbi:TetR/AcrR family transcriptional regulator [Pseudoruegeria sp. SHC-113]|uniref:TetR/AcrR family transcriptional regulator n=1 Tax=Pseudoruegeria sp. SHC-113 TaxID=2855439 RepID=UPI0021BAB5FD|nr:TetR/AcrR family transcriptional regulator [Pseudoruegeria sp. SHC-113]MCT8159870.1 TetR/AcrR family transcriptional regulator [Pseudoruegeria sp. SHC-113]
MKRPRSAQKSRTRAALLDGARELLSKGQPVTVAAAGEARGISKATAYRYFSDAAILVAEAGLDIHVKPYAEVTRGARDLRGKLRAINLYFFDLALENEAAFRQFVGMTLTHVSCDDAPGAHRGARRIAMYEAALADHPGAMPKVNHTTLLRALSACTGTEAMIGLIDVAGADRSEARAIVDEMTLALLDRLLPT